MEDLPSEKKDLVGEFASDRSLIADQELKVEPLILSPDVQEENISEDPVPDDEISPAPVIQDTKIPGCYGEDQILNVLNLGTGSDAQAHVSTPK